MNKNFENQFNITKKLMKKSLYKDEDWVLQVISELDSLKKYGLQMCPTGRLLKV